MSTNPLQEFFDRREREELLEHRDVLLAINSILESKEGRQIFEYLFKSLEVTGLPDASMEDKALYEYLGFLRAGNSIYKLVCESDPEIAASILTKIERKRYDNTIEQHRIEHEHYTNSEN